MMNKKGQLVTYIFAFMILTLIIVVAAIIAPFGVQLNTDLYAAGEDILLQSNESISNINDATVRAEIYDIVDKGLDSTQDNIRVNTAIYKYSWVVVLFVFSFIWYLTTRQDVQGRGGFV